MSTNNGHDEFEGKITWYVVLSAIIAATGGLMFGYDIGISGGVTGMDDFLKKFFNQVYVKKHEVKESNYYKYDNQGLQLFTSSLYLAAIVASFVASKVCKRYGRKLTMQAASIFFLVGVVLDAAAMNLPILIVERIFLGFGVGFANQAVPLFLSEIAPTRIRGALNILFQLQIFQQFTGINAIMFYAPVLFQTMGFKNNASLLSSVITGLVNVFSTVVSVVLVDKVGRKALLLQACVQMLISQSS
ncbi:hypothetical protein J5N97_019903 [Dioscorea zingiberensis]|uniref:Major facilitator superfamily (MFS) profile domain-containing protein n=1 Tax=Dioscorea zingiberensis TaxID=325984 RepID=A0A9D5HCX5_9LILI|nr:hypothetical protein J5N97_019903 [Dioscorea zingiberensis]